MKAIKYLNENKLISIKIKHLIFINLNIYYFISLLKLCFIMTHLIDLVFQSSKLHCNRSCASQKTVLTQQNTKIYSIHQLIKKFIRTVDKINIKTIETYVFQLHQHQFLQKNSFYNPSIKIIGMISLGKGIFSLRFQFFDDQGIKIHAKSTHHNTMISRQKFYQQSFVFQINSQLQNFKLEFNPLSGQFAFVFKVKTNFLQRGMVSQLVEYAISSYFEEYQAHLYVLNLIEYINQKDNQYLKNISKDYIFLKKWTTERISQKKYDMKSLSFYTKLQLIIQKEQESIKQKQNQFDQREKIKMIQTYLYPQTKKRIDEIDLQQSKTRKEYKRFKSYYNQQEILSIHMANKNKFQNLISLKPKNATNILNFLSGRKLIKQNLYKQHNLQKKMQQCLYQQDFSQIFTKQNKEIQNQYDSKSDKSDYAQDKVKIFDKQSGKNYLAKLVHLKTNFSTELRILEKLCKYESYNFFNQYFELESFNLVNHQYVVVNANPKRILLFDFLKKNNQIITFLSKVNISINLIQIIYTLNIKSKIQNYYPFISTKNIEISRKLYLNFKLLSSISVHPLIQIVNTISYIFFQTSLHRLKRDSKYILEIVKADQVQNKNYGPSICIYFLKFYLLELHQQALRMIKINELRQNKKNKSHENQQIDQWKKQRIMKICQQLLVIFCHFKSIFAKEYDEQFNFQDSSEFED